MSLSAVISQLYESEINCGLETFWDGGVTVWLGDYLNGRSDETSFSREQVSDSMEEVVNWIQKVAIHRYPKSEYAKTHGSVSSCDCSSIKTS